MSIYNGGNVIAHVGADISDYQSAMRNVAGATQGAMQSANQAFESIGKTLAVTGAAITAIGVKSMNGFGDFQASLNKAAVIAGGTSKDIQGLADVANKMGADLPLSARDAADAMVAMARDGASINTIKSEFPAIAQAATAAGADLQTTASVVQQSMNIWGESLKSPQQSAAILTQTANLSNASIEDMQQALATIGGTANNAGIDMQTVSTALGLLTNRGFSAAQASQDLNHALLLMQAPSKKGAEMMSSLGLSMTDVQGNMKPLPQILNEIGDATSNMTSSDKAAALKTMFGTAGMAAILPLMKSVKDTTDNTTTSWSAFTDEMNKASSSTQIATKFLANQATEMQKNLGSRLEQVGGNWEALRNAAMAGSSGVISSIADMTSSTLEWATTSHSAIGRGIRTFLGMTPVIGAATLATGSFLTAATKIGSVVSTLGTAMKAMFLSPLGLAIIAMGAFAGAVSLAYKYSQPFRDAINNIAKAFSSVFGPAISNSEGKMKKFGGTVGGVMKSLGEWFGQKMANAINGVDWIKVFTKIEKLIQSVTRVAKQAVDVFSLLAIKIANSGAASNAWHGFKSVLDTVYQSAKFVYNIAKQIYDMLGNIGGVGSNTGKTLQSAFAIGSLLAIPIGLKLLPSILGLIFSPAKKLTSVFGDLLGKLNPFGRKTKSAVDEISKGKKPLSSFAAKTLEVGVGIGAAGAGLGAFAFGIAKLASQGQQGTTTLKTFGVLVGLLAAEFALLGRGLTAGSVGIGVFLGGMTALALAFTALASTGKQGQDTMITFGLVVAGLAAVFAILSPVLTAGAVGIGVFGAAVLAVGIGIGIASLGLAALITAINNTNVSFGQIINTLTAVGIGFAGLITGFVTTLATNMPIIAKSLLGMLVEFLNQLIIYTPIITQQFIQIILGFVGVITNNIPQIVLSITNLLLAMMAAIGDNAPQLVAGFAAMLGKFGLAIIEIMPYVFQLTGALIAGMIAVVATYSNSFNEIGGVILNALIAGVTGKKYDAVSAAADIMNSAGKSASDNGVKAFDVAGGNSAIAALNAISKNNGGANSAGAELGKSAASGVSSQNGNAYNAGNGVANSVKSGVGNVNLASNGESIMGGFLSGLQGTNWGRVMGFVGSVAGWIASHKGPINYDRKLLIPAGAAIMGGFGSSLNANFADVKKSVSSYAGQIADEFGQQKYTASAKLTTSSSGVASQINGGLSSLSDQVAEQQTQQPVFQVFNEIIGDKITTTVNSKNSRRQATIEIMGRGR